MKLHQLVTIAAPAPHYLESWGDIMITKGTYSLTQPTIRPIFNTKQFQDVLLSLNGVPGNFYDYLKASSAGLLQVLLGIKFYMMVFL